MGWLVVWLVVVESHGELAAINVHIVGGGGVCCKCCAQRAKWAKMDQSG